MRITTRGRYALRASLALAQMAKDGEPVSILSLSEEEKISSVFLEQIFFKLRKAGIVSSVRGPGGGFRFSRPLEELTVKEILDAAGEDLSEGTCDKHNDTCERMGGCISHKVWAGVIDRVNTYLRSLTIASLIKDAEPVHESAS
jgi:Rrf2 family iron-sulfur cluster assembly transcriptional regulator